MDTAHFQQLIAENTGDVIAVFSLNWKYVQVSDSCKNVLNYTPQELISHSFYEFMHPDDLNKILEEMNQLNQSFKSQFLTFRLKRKDGNFIWVETLLKRLEILDQNHYPLVLGVIKDITTRRNSEEMVKKFVEGVQYASDCIAMANPDGKIMYVNPSVEALTGYSPEEIIGQHANTLWGGLEDANKIVNMWNTLQKQKITYQDEVSNITKDGKTYFTEVRISPILDQNRDVTFFVGISRDSTKTKEADKMKNDFISLVSHRLQTPLASMLTTLDTLNHDQTSKLTEKQTQLVKQLTNANKTMSELIKSFLNISYIESGRLLIEPKMSSLEEIMMSTIDDIEASLKEKNIELKISFQTNVYDVNVDPKLLRCVYSNLLSNSAKYTPVNGKIEVAIYTEDGQVVTRIKDTGCGIPKVEQKNIFEKFYRAENAKKIDSDGTGLGMYLVHAIMEESNGKVWFESNENEGTTLYVSVKATGMIAKQGEVSISE